MAWNLQITIWKWRENGFSNRLISIFQPHLYTRTRDFFKEFADAFRQSDIAIFTNIYEAREKPINGISTELITNELKKNGHSNVIYVPKKEDIPKIVKNLYKSGDLIITMGAGDIWRQIKKISEEISIWKKWFLKNWLILHKIEFI